MSGSPVDRRFARQSEMVPFVPSRFDDELLGSWLSRIRCGNGARVFSRLLIECGLGRRLVFHSHDVPKPSSETEALLATLGTDLRTVLEHHTTHPYWIFFDAELPSGQVRVEIGPDGNLPERRMRGPAKRFRGPTSLVRRFCVECLTEDLETVGVPFWHRSHHLPLVFFICARHGTRLRSTCARCGVAAVETPYLSSCRLRCQCGADLRTGKRQSALAGTAAWLALARFSRDIASSEHLIAHDRGFVESFASTLGARLLGSKRTAFEDLLASTYHLKLGGASLRPGSAITDYCGVGQPLMRGRSRAMSASGLAATFAALGLSPSELQSQLAMHEQRIEPAAVELSSRTNRRVGTPHSVPHARRVAQTICHAHAPAVRQFLDGELPAHIGI